MIADRAMLRGFARALVQTTLGFFALTLTLELFNQMHWLGEGYQLPQAVWYSMCLFPRNVYRAMPMVLVVATLTVLVRYVRQQEWLMLACSGLSVQRFLRPLIVALVMSIVVLSLLGETLGPEGTRYAKSMRTRQLSGGQVSMSERGLRWKDGQDFVVARWLPETHALRDVLLIRASAGGRLDRVAQATRGTYQKGHWLLEGYRATDVSTGRPRVVHADAQVWAGHMTPHQLTLLTHPPHQSSLSALYAGSRLKHQAQPASNAMAQVFWQRVRSPWLTLLLCVAAMPWMVGHNRRWTLQQRVAAGLVSSLGAYAVVQACEPVLLFYRWSAVSIAWLPLCVPVSVIVLGFAWVKRRG